MKSQKNLLRILLPLIAGTLLHTAHSAVMVETENFSFVPSGSQILTFSKFDSTLGALTKVSVSITLSKIGGTFAIDNDSTSSGMASLNHKITLTLFSNSLGALSMLKNDFSPVITSGFAAETTTEVHVEATSGDAIGEFNNTGAGDYVKVDPLPSISASASGDVNSGGTSLYVGAAGDFFTITVGADQVFSVTGVGGVASATMRTFLFMIAQLFYHQTMNPYHF